LATRFHDHHHHHQQQRAAPPNQPIDCIARPPPPPEPLTATVAMGKAKKTRKFAQVKRMISSRDGRLKANAEKEAAAAQKKEKDELVREMCARKPLPYGVLLLAWLIREKKMADPKSHPRFSSNTTKPCVPRTRCWSIPTSSTSASRRN
jgi:hypothetical protein